MGKATILSPSATGYNWGTRPLSKKQQPLDGFGFVFVFVFVFVLPDCGIKYFLTLGLTD